MGGSGPMCGTTKTWSGCIFANYLHNLFRSIFSPPGSSSSSSPLLHGDDRPTACRVLKEWYLAQLADWWWCRMLWGGHETITSMRMTVGVATKVSLGLLFEKTTTTTKEAEAVEAPGWMSTYCFNCYVNNINNLNWNVKNTFQFISSHRIALMRPLPSSFDRFERTKPLYVIEPQVMWW